jgi:choline-sulfatase
MDTPNILFICADEHTRHALNCYGASFIKSPNLDRLAAAGTRFASAYTNSPLCVPARASLFTGEYVHDTGCWDNGHPYHGVPPGWAHRLRDRGYHTVSIGKNHFRSVADDNGFDHELLPMHVRNGIGDLFGMLRTEGAPYSAEPGHAVAADAHASPGDAMPRGPAIMAEAAGAGETNHTRYDRAIAARACDWLRGVKNRQAPWALFVAFVAPHFPLIAPREFYELYPHDSIPKPDHYAPSERPSHPVVQALARVWNFDDFFDDEKVLRARAGYYALISFLDFNIGRIINALDEAGQRDNTFIIYTSDHGEMLGNKGIWSTSALYEHSVGVPLIMAGPDVAAGAIVTAPVSHVDVLPTLLQVAGDTTAAKGPGRSLLQLDDSLFERAVLSEYHAGGSITGCFMLRRGRWKYHHYVGYRPELFDIEADPSESRDLAEDSANAEVRAGCESALREILDPELVSARAFARQAATIESHGGIEAVKARGHAGEHSLDRRLGVE